MTVPQRLVTAFDEVDDRPKDTMSLVSKLRSDDPRLVQLRPRGALSSVEIGDTIAIGAEQPVDHPDNLLPRAKGGHHKAFRLLEEVKAFIPQILQENDLLRHSLVDVRSQAEHEIESAEAQAWEWKTSAELLKDQVASLEAMVLELRSKLDMSESIVAIEKELASKAGQDAAEAECLSKLFEDTVIRSFGVGTMFQDALARIEAAST